MAPKDLAALGLFVAMLIGVIPISAHASCQSPIKTCVPGISCDNSCLDYVMSVCKLPAQILEAYKRDPAGGMSSSQKGCNNFGLPLTPPRPRLSVGGTYQEFARGEIATYSQWSRDPNANTPEFALGAFLTTTAQGKQKITVNWGSTKRYNYEAFLLRWDRDDHKDAVAKQHKKEDCVPLLENCDPQQVLIEQGGSSGSHIFDVTAAEGTYVIYVEGCNNGGWFSGLVCEQGWSHPVYVDHLPTLPTMSLTYNSFSAWGLSIPIPIPKFWPVPLAPMAAPSIAPGVLVDVGDPVGSPPFQISPILDFYCDKPLINEKGELNTINALARLEMVRQKQSCKSKNSDALQTEVRDAISTAKVSTVPGTDIGGFEQALIAAAAGGILATFFVLTSGIFTELPVKVVTIVAAVLGAGAIGAIASKRGDYDMTLVGLVRMAYAYPVELGPEARKTLIDKLLTVCGPESKRRNVVWLFGLPTPIPETENHIWMTESARFLTNNLIAEPYKLSGTPIPKEYDNDQNGMTHWMLGHVREMLVEDSYEFNSRPYAPYTFDALVNLYDFASFGSTCVLPVLAGSPPLATGCDVSRAVRNGLDFLVTKFAASSNGLRRAAPFRRQPPFRDYPRLWTTGGDDMTWRMFFYTGGSDVFRDERHLRYMEGARGMMMEAAFSRYRPPVILTDLMRQDSGSAYWQRFRSTRREGDTVEIYYRRPEYLISAGGRFGQGKGIANWTLDTLTPFSGGEEAWALPTTLMPSKAGGDYRDFVRILGHSDETKRVNTCVGPGFACGMNPTIPTGLPAECRITNGNWTFIDFNANTPTCPFDYGFHVAFYAERCASSDCRDAAGSATTLTSPSFGFFEAVPARNFQDYMASVLSLNGNWDYRFDKVNVYKSPYFLTTTFVFNNDPNQWGIVDYGANANLERKTEAWRIATGSVVSSPRDACIVINNPHLGQQLILDHTDVNRPRRALLARPRRDCMCPLPDQCLNPRAE